jgi:GDP-L-fucose synthase
MPTFWSEQRVLVTGGSGFVGRSVVRQLDAKAPAAVFTPSSRDYDLTQPEAARQLFDDTDPTLVIHLAARVGGIGANMAHPAELYLANLLMGTYVIEEARRKGTDKSVLVGTICSYPKIVPMPFKEETLWDGYPEETNAPYGIAKKALLVHAQANRDQYGQNSVFLLPTNLFGPGDKFHPSVSHVIPALIKKCVDAKEQGSHTLDVWGTGAATREFLYVDDAAEGMLLAAEHYDGADPVNLGSGEELAIRDLAELIARHVGFDGELKWDPSKPDGQPRRKVDTTRAEKTFGFVAHTTMEDGLRRTIEWYLANRDEAESAAF